MIPPAMRAPSNKLTGSRHMRFYLNLIEVHRMTLDITLKVNVGSNNLC